MANDLMARQLALQAKKSIQTLDSTDVSGLGTAATKNTGTSAGQIPLTDSGGKILIDVIPDSISSGQLYKGVWDASVGTFPTATVVGEFYIVSVAGTISTVTYNKNDQIIWNGTTFDHVDNAQLVTFAEDIQRIGFVDRTSTEVPYLSGASMDIVNLDDAGAGWSYYLNGDKYTISGNKTVELTGGAGNAHANGIYWIVINTSDGALSVSQDTPDFATNVLVSYVYWNESLSVGNQSLIADERHTILWDSDVHFTFHNTVGVVMDGSIDISNYQLDSISDGNKQYSLSSGLIYDEDIELEIDSLTGGNGVYTNFYRTAEGVWGWETDANFPFRYADSGRMLYDSTSGGTECGDGKFINTYCIVSNLTGNPRFITFTSQQEYDSETEARRELGNTINVDGLFTNELFCTHKITWNTNDLFTPSTGKCKIVHVKEIMNNVISLDRIYKLRTNEVTPSVDRNYLTDAQLVVVENTSGENTGDETSETIATALGYTPVAGNDAIVSATKTKITYDTKGLITVGEDATTADIADSADKRYVTDAQETAITHTNRANLDTINQDLATTSNVTFNNVTTTGYTMLSMDTIEISSETVNNLVIPATDIVKITDADDDFRITGIAGGVAGRKLILYNTTYDDMDIANSSSSSLSQNRILTMGYTIGGSNQSTVTMFYDGVQSRWIVTSSVK